MRSTHESDDAFEAWVDGEEQLRAHAVHAAFRGGWNAGRDAERQAARETIAKLMAALAWYADERQYAYRPFAEGLGGLPLVTQDDGERARAALDMGAPAAAEEDR